MNDQAQVYLAGMGMITSVGGSALTTAAAVRARRKGMRTSETFKNRACKPLTLATVPDAALPEFAGALQTHEDINLPIGRMLLMAHATLEDIQVLYPETQPLPVMLAGPAAYTGQEVPFSHAFFDLLAEQTGIEFDWPNSRLLAMGRSGVLTGIDMAIKYLNLGTGNYVLVGGVDSYQDHDLLLQLDARDRIKTEDAKDSFIPGEAAGFLLLTNKPERAQRFGNFKIGLTAPGLAEESGHLYSEQPYRGDGLAHAFQVALANAPGLTIQTIYSSMNGENHWTKELGVAQIRNSHAIAEDVKIEHPADCLGDTGAATGAVLIGLAALDLQKGWRKGPALVYCSSDHAPRAAVCVSLVT